MVVAHHLPQTTTLRTSRLDCRVVSTHRRAESTHSLDRQCRRRRFSALDLAEDIRRVRNDHARCPIGENDDEPKFTISSLKRLGNQPLTAKRMRRRDNGYLCRQPLAKLLQSVAISVGVGKTFLATALGHAAVRRRYSVHFERADQMFKRLKASRLDNSHDAEMRKLLRVDHLLLDDFCLQPLDAADTADVYELIVERHRHAATVTTSNREPIEWLSLMADALLAQSAIDRLQSSAYELILEGESYRSRQKPSPGDQTELSQRLRRRA